MLAAQGIINGVIHFIINHAGNSVESFIAVAENCTAFAFIYGGDFDGLTKSELYRHRIDQSILAVGPHTPSTGGGKVCVAAPARLSIFQVVRGQNIA